VSGAIIMSFGVILGCALVGVGGGMVEFASPVRVWLGRLGCAVVWTGLVIAYVSIALGASVDAWSNR
jgi:hypothetical protein